MMSWLSRNLSLRTRQIVSYDRIVQGLLSLAAVRLKESPLKALCLLPLVRRILVIILASVS